MWKFGASHAATPQHESTCAASDAACNVASDVCNVAVMWQMTWQVTRCASDVTSNVASDVMVRNQLV